MKLVLLGVLLNLITVVTNGVTFGFSSGLTVFCVGFSCFILGIYFVKALFD